MNYRAQPRPVPRSNSDLELDLPANLRAEFQERSAAFNQQHIPTVPATNVAPPPAPPQKKIALSIPPQVKDTAIAVSLWSFGWILASTITQGLGVNFPDWAMVIPLGLVVAIAQFRPINWQQTTYAILGHYLALLLL